MATIQDRWNPSKKVSVSSAGELYIRGSNSDGSIKTSESGDESLIFDDYTTASTSYVCTAPPGTLSSAASWKVKRLDETGDYLVIEYADGDDEYDNIADNRASLSYS
ncbi:MAG: hypothetical protein DRP42_05155 [Tenericutes bacterium]|nr:MAG: hypothetical protein DRP42_05155 [Mycoplasmatota bacterium]